MESNQEAIERFLRTNDRILGLQAETGAGKTEQILRDRDPKVILTPTILLGEEIFGRADGLGREVVIWRSRDYRWDQIREQYEDPSDWYKTERFKDGVVCIQPDACNNLIAKGGNANKAICPSCKAYESCEYMKQSKDHRNAEFSIIAMPNLFTDRQLSGFAQIYISQGETQEDLRRADRVVIVDEAHAHKLFNRHVITKESLENVIEMWEGKEAAVFCEELLNRFEDPLSWRPIVMDLSGEDIAKINRQLSQIRFRIMSVIEDTVHDGITHRIMTDTLVEGVFLRAESDEKYKWLCDYTDLRFIIPPYNVTERKFINLTIDQCYSGRVFDFRDPEKSELIPKMEEKSYTMVHKLQRCFRHYRQPPILVEPERIIFYTPPDLSDEMVKMILVSATLDEPHLRKAFSGESVSFEKTAPTPFVDGAKFFQMDTGRYSVNTLLRPDSNNLSDTGMRFVKVIESLIAKDPDHKYAIITSKRIIKKCEESWNDLGIVMVNYGQIEGLDTLFADVQRIIILGSHEIPPPEIMMRSKLLFGDEEEPLDDTRKQDDLGNYYYIDDRVQSVYDHATIGEIKQAIGRARLNRNAKQVYLFSSHTIDDYTNRAIAFDIVDLEQCQTFDDLEEIATKYRKIRYQTESDILAAFKEADYDISISAVVNRTGKSRQQVQKIYDRHVNIIIEERNMELQKKVEALLAGGISKRQIQKELKITRRKVDNILAKIGEK